MIFPKDKGFKHETYGAGDVQALLKAQEVRDQKQTKLPDVTAEDNGKVLAVVDGAWNKAAVPSGGGEFVYFYTAPVPNTNKIKLLNDKTVTDIAACLDSQKIPILVHGSNSSNISFTPYAWTDQDDNGHEIYVFSISSIAYEDGEFKPFIAATYFETTDPAAIRGTVVDYDIPTT